jgi:NADH-quinone oxidoreductase subunit H
MASFLDIYVWPTLLTVAYILLIIIPLLLCVAYLTYAERKVMAAVQIRRGPNVVGPWGLLQPLADGVKLVFKETIIPTTANRVVFMVAPMITFVLALVAWAVIPFDAGVVLANINVGVLYLFAISSLGVYGVIMAGWASNSKYPFLGALRSAAQMVSYEVSIGFVIITVLLASHSLNLSAIIESQRGESGYFWNWYAFGMLAPMAVIFFISALAETNRVPFDLPEGESELVAGFFAEYSSMAFGLFFLGEYANIILMSTTTTIFFLGGWLSPVPFAPFTAAWFAPIWFVLKVSFVIFLFLLVRATFPRFRYDQLMRLGWKVFLPLSLLWVVVTAGVMLAVGRWPF